MYEKSDSISLFFVFQVTKNLSPLARQNPKRSKAIKIRGSGTLLKTCISSVRKKTLQAIQRKTEFQAAKLVAATYTYFCARTQRKKKNGLNFYV